MKNLIYLAGLFLMFSFAACDNDAPDNNSEYMADDEEGDDGVVMTQTQLEKMDDDELDFNGAVAALKAGKTEAAAAHIEADVEDIKDEITDIKEPAKRNIQSSLTVLSDFADEVRSGTIQGNERIAEAFANAEMLIAYNYLTLAEAYGPDDKDAARDAMETAREKLKNAADKLVGEPKAEAEALAAEINVALVSEQDWADKVGKVAGNTAEKITGWLKRHYKELGGEFPKHDPAQ